MPQGFVVAIPSRGRVDVLRRYTYSILSTRLRAIAHVFVQSRGDAIAYSAAFPDVHIVPARHNGRWVQGYAAVVEFIRGYFPLGQAILFVHDDVRGVVCVKPPSTRRRPVRLMLLARRLLAAVRRSGGCLGGVYPMDNPMAMVAHAAYTVGRVFVYDPVHLEINCRLPRCRAASKCDYETSAEAFRRCGPNVRLNRFCALTAHRPLHKQSWRRTRDRLLRETLSVLRRYPDFYGGYAWRRTSGDTALRVLRTTRYGASRTP